MMKTLDGYMGSCSVRTEFSVDCSILYRNECLETNSKKGPNSHRILIKCLVCSIS
jgi:hypothetical protein